MEYAHEHLDKIIDEQAAADEYEIPSELMSNKSVILEQIKIINQLFPKCSLEPKVKRNKTDETPQSATTKPTALDKNISAAASSNPHSGASSQAKAGASSAQSDPRSKANIHDYIKVVAPKGRMADKLAASRPYNYFLTSITSSPPTHNEPLSITFQEILDPSLGELESSVQINFMVEAGWLLGQYYFAGHLNKPLLILYGSGSPELETISQLKPQVTAHLIKMPTPFATHHTKMMILGYKDGSMRVVISTANLYEDDWHNRTQGTNKPFISLNIFH